MFLSRYIEDIQIFGVNMTFISSNEVKKMYMSGGDEIKVIFTRGLNFLFIIY